MVESIFCYRAARLRLSEDNQTCLNCRAKAVSRFSAAKVRKNERNTKRKSKSFTFLFPSVEVARQSQVTKDS